MNGILEITEQRRKELVNISLGIKIQKPPSASYKPLYIHAKKKPYVYKKPLLKSQTPSRTCKGCSTLVYGKAQFCVNHRYVYQRPMPDMKYCSTCDTKIFGDVKHCAQHRTKSKRRGIVKES